MQCSRSDVQEGEIVGLDKLPEEMVSETAELHNLVVKTSAIV